MEGTLQQINLSEVGDTVGAAPSSSLIGSVRSHGVIQPIVIAELPDENGELRLKLIDGNRRVKAARANGLASIPAILFTNADPDSVASLTLVLNGFRTANYLTEFWAIKQLEKLGFHQKDIQTISGQSRSKVNDRASLSGLNREIFVALRNGEIVQSHAISIAKLPKDAQEALAAILRKTGRIQLTDISRYKPARQSEKETTSVLDSLQKPAWSSESSSVPVGSEITTSPHVQPVADAETSSQARTLSASSKAMEHISEPENESSIPKPSTPLSHKVDVKPSSPSLLGIHSTSDAELHGNSTPVERRDGDQRTTISSRTVNHMRSAVIAAQILDLTKEDFLEMADRIWDETVNRHAELHHMQDQTPKEHFPDLSAHKWDTGES